MSSDQLAKLQEALIEGRIDKETYESLKADILAAQEKPASASTPPEQPKQTDHPWVRGKITLNGTGGTVLNADEYIEVYMDDELIGEGTANKGIHLSFETTTGDHTLTLKGASKKRGVFSSVIALIPQVSQVFPIQFDSPGDYEIMLRYKSLSKFFSGNRGNALPTKIEMTKQGVDE